MRHTLAAVLASVLASPAPTEASTIIGYVSRALDAIFIAADSRFSGDTQAVTDVDSACKIHVYDGLIFAATGEFLVQRAGRTIFSLESLIPLLHSQGAGDTHRRRVDRFTQKLMDAFSEAEAEPEFRAAGGSGLASIFGFVEDGRPILVFRQYPDGVDQTIDFSSRRPTMFGEIAAIQHETIDQEVDLPSRLTEIISLQARATPLSVGGPVDIIRLTTDGAEWLQRKPECPERE